MIVIKRNEKIGRGFGSLLFKRLSSSRITKEGAKNAIKRAANSALAHKVADAVVNGAVNATEKLVEDAVVKSLKRNTSNSDQVEKKKFFAGSGIVLD